MAHVAGAESTSSSTSLISAGIPLIRSGEPGAVGFMDATGRFLVGPYEGTRMVDWAIKYAEHGWAVFPMRRGTKGFFGKCPQCNDESAYYDAEAHANGVENCSVDHGDAYPRCHGLWAATTNTDAIRAWWTTHPDANIGINCGLSNIALVDVDIKLGKTGDQSITELERRYEQFPVGPRVRTASGGWHWLHAIPEGINLRSSVGKTITKTGARSGLADFVDIKAHGGLMVAAPSVIYDNTKGRVVGQYTWTNDWTQELPVLPLWVSEEITRREAEGRPTRTSIPYQRDGENADLDEAMEHVNDLADQVATMGEPGRRDLLLTNAGHCFRMAEAGQVSHADVAFILEEAGLRCGLPESEVKRAVREARKWAVGKARPWKAAFNSESLLREYADFMTPELRKSLFREGEPTEVGNDMDTETVVEEPKTEEPMEFIVTRPTSLTTPEQIAKHRDDRLVEGVQPFDVGSCPLPEDELEWTLCVAATATSGWYMQRLDEMCQDIRKRGEEALREHAPEVERWNLPTYDLGAEGPGAEAWGALVSAAVASGMDRSAAEHVANQNTGAANAIEVAKQWRDAHPDEFRNLADNVGKWLRERYGVPVDGTADEDTHQEDGGEKTVVGLADALEQEMIKRQAIIEASKIEARRSETDPAYIPSYEIRAYEQLLGREKAQKRRAEELRVEEPEDDFGEIFDRLASGDTTDRRPMFGYLADDDCGLFYEGTTNGIYGKSGIGKSIIQARLQVEAMRNGKNVVHWEYDNNSNNMIVQRLFDAGVTREQITTQFKVVRSVEEMDRRLTDEFRKNVGLVTLDALTPAISALGGEVNHPSGTDLVLRTLMQPFTAHGAVGFFLGHVGHENQDRMAGSNRMFAAMQGALYNAEVVVQPSLGNKGLVKLILKKDNQGYAGEVDRLSAWVTYDSTKGDGSVLTAFSRERNTKDVQEELESLEREKTQNADRSTKQDVQTIWNALSKAGEALSINDLYILLKDRGESISERQIRTRLDKMLKDNMVFIDTEASKRPAASNGGKPCKRYRAAAVPSS